VKLLVFTILSSIYLTVFTIGLEEKERIISYQDISYNTPFGVDNKFIGTYEGRKAGYLKLNADGTGVYKYDIFGYAPASCERKPIIFIWGFILDKEGKMMAKKRDYGNSYPILLESTGSNSFQGCRTAVLKEFILDMGKSLHVSSSDDWKKVK
jgi:hypothetical protein